MLSRFFQESDHLLALYARESFEELLDRIASFQMIEKTLYRNAGPSKDRFTPENVGILRYHAAHDYKNTACSIATKPICSWALTLKFTNRIFQGAS